jgi:large subunit ribosomal protein L21
MKYAIVQSGGRQHRCEVGGAVEVDRLAVETGTTYEFKEVLLVADENGAKVGQPTVPGAVVTATVEGEIKGPKVVAFRYKAKERQRRKRGHRAVYTRLKIEQIVE